jgi:AcrR family transcriptional regulator
MTKPEGSRSSKARASKAITADGRSKRQKIIDAAADVFASQPYETVNIDEIARAADVAHGLVFYHFKDKRGLYVATVTHLLHELDQFVAPRPEETTPELEVRGSLTRYLQYLARYPVAMQSLLRVGLQDVELGEPYENTRQLGLGRLLSSLGEVEHAKVPTLRVALRGWMGFVDQVTTEWLDADHMLAIDDYVELCFDALIWTLHSAEGHRPTRRGLALHLSG